MKLHNKLDEILNQPSKIKILRFLFAEKDEHTGRGIAKAISLSPSVTHKALGEMRTVGIINAKRKGNAILYKLKEDNYFVKKLLGVLFEKEKSVYNDVVSFINNKLYKHKSYIVSACVFGSVATGRESTGSDMDLLVVIRTGADKNKINVIFDKLNVDLAKEFGIALSPYIITRAVFKKRYSEKQKLAVSIVKNNRLICGEPIERVVA